MTKLAKLSVKLKGGDWVDPDDPLLIVENELFNAALSIEKAAKRLATLRPKKEVFGQVTIIIPHSSLIYFFFTFRQVMKI